MSITINDDVEKANSNGPVTVNMKIKAKKGRIDEFEAVILTGGRSAQRSRTCIYPYNERIYLTGSTLKGHYGTRQANTK